MEGSMKTSNYLWMAALLIILPGRAGATEPFRVLWRGTGGWGNKSAYCALFDTKTIQTVRGVVVSVDSVTPMPGMRPGIELQLKTDKWLIPIHLGPLWYLENQDIDIKPNDTVEVTGSKIFCEGQQVIAATEVRHGNKTIKLRDSQGKPLWVASTQEEK
jgi:hypothetical protein